MRYFFSLAKGSDIDREVLGDTSKLLNINSLDVVADPVKTMSKICQILVITCPNDFLQACAKMVDPTPSMERTFVVRRQEHIDRMYSEIRQYPFLANNTFDRLNLIAFVCIKGTLSRLIIEISIFYLPNYIAKYTDKFD